MGCRKGCGSSLGNIELIVKDIIRQMIEAGQLQEGIVDCNEQRIWRNGHVVTCDILGSAICQLAEEGALCFKEIEAVTFDEESRTLSILFNDGTKTSTTLPVRDTKVKSVELDGTTLVITSTDKSSVRVDLLPLIKGVQSAIAEVEKKHTALEKKVEDLTDDLNEANGKITALETALAALTARVDAIPVHHADVLLTDGTGDVDLSYTHATQEM